MDNETVYRNQLIVDILEWQTRRQFSRETLIRKRTEVLEIIHDNVD